MPGRPRHRSLREDELAPLFYALSDPTRRRILDLLRRREHTTGQLAEAFPSSRFAVMKHLAALGRVGLVVSRREGRQRWNHLNAVPLRRLYERWVEPYSGHWAGKLLDLKRTVEGKNMASTKELSAAVVELEVPIDAPPAKVWKAIVDEPGRWWRKDFYAGPAKELRLEARPGGRLWEDWGEGGGLVWYTVAAVSPGKSIDLAGHLMPAYCGGSAATTFLRLELEARGKKTVLKLTDNVFGRLTGDLQASLKTGWAQLFGALKEFVEAASA
jgi:DNA-binding transcriptional ArsR family regulator